MRILLASMVAMAAAFQPLAPRSSSLTRPAAFGKPKPTTKDHPLSTDEAVDALIDAALQPGTPLTPDMIRMEYHVDTLSFVELFVLSPEVHACMHVWMCICRYEYTHMDIHV